MVAVLTAILNTEYSYIAIGYHNKERSDLATLCSSYLDSYLVNDGMLMTSLVEIWTIVWVFQIGAGTK